MRAGSKKVAPIGVRLSPELMSRLDRFVEAQRKKTGFRITRSGAIARFVELGLKKEER